MEKSSSSDKLINVFSSIWYDIDVNILDKLYESMIKRVTSVIKSKGLPTKHWDFFMNTLKLLFF